MIVRVELKVHRQKYTFAKEYELPFIPEVGMTIRDRNFEIRISNLTWDYIEERFVVIIDGDEKVQVRTESINSLIHNMSLQGYRRIKDQTNANDIIEGEIVQLHNSEDKYTGQIMRVNKVKDNGTGICGFKDSNGKVVNKGFPLAFLQPVLETRAINES
jgi:hypothetical protein